MAARRVWDAEGAGSSPAGPTRVSMLAVPHSSPIMPTLTNRRSSGFWARAHVDDRPLGNGSPPGLDPGLSTFESWGASNEPSEAWTIGSAPAGSRFGFAVPVGVAVAHEALTLAGRRSNRRPGATAASDGGGWRSRRPLQSPRSSSGESAGLRNRVVVRVRLSPTQSAPGGIRPGSQVPDVDGWPAVVIQSGGCQAALVEEDDRRDRVLSAS